MVSSAEGGEMELHTRIMAVSGAYADQFRAGSLLALLNSHRNQRSRFMQLRTMVRSKEHFALALRVRESVHCLIILDRVPLSALVPTRPQVVTFVRMLQRGHVHRLPHTLVAEFPADLVTLQLCSGLKFKHTDSASGSAVPSAPIRTPDRSGISRVDMNALLSSEGEALLAADMTGKVTMWQFSSSSFSWTLLVTIELCTPASMITSAAIDCATGMLVWSERHVDANPKQQVQDRVRCCTLYKDASAENLRGSPSCTVVQSRCTALHIVPGGCWLLDETLVMFYDRSAQRVYAHTVAGLESMKEQGQDKASVPVSVSCLHLNPSLPDPPDVCVFSNGYVYNVQVRAPKLNIVTSRPIATGILDEFVMSIAAADNVLFILTSCHTWFVSLVSGEILSRTAFPDFLTRLSGDRTFSFWQIRFDERASSGAMRRGSRSYSSETARSTWLSPRSPSFSTDIGAQMGIWGHTCLCDMFVSNKTSIDVSLGLPRPVDSTRGDIHAGRSASSLHAVEDIFQDALFLLREKGDKATDKAAEPRSPAVADIMFLPNANSISPDNSPPGPRELGPGLVAARLQPLHSFRSQSYRPRPSTSSTTNSRDYALPGVGEDGFQTPSALDLLLASCGRGFECEITPSVSMDALNYSPLTIGKSLSSTSLTELGQPPGALSAPDVTVDGPSRNKRMSAWIASLDESMLPTRQAHFTLSGHFDPFRLLAIANSINVETTTDRFFEGACCLLFARDPTLLYDTVMSIRETSESASCDDNSESFFQSNFGEPENALVLQTSPKGSPRTSSKGSTLTKYEHLSRCTILHRCLAALHVDESRGSLSHHQQDALLRLMLAARRFTRAAQALVSWSRVIDAAALCKKLTRAADMHMTAERSALLINEQAAKTFASPADSSLKLTVIGDMPHAMSNQCVDVFQTTLLACLRSDQHELLPTVFSGMPWFISFKDIALIIKQASVQPIARTDMEGTDVGDSANGLRPPSPSSPLFMQHDQAPPARLTARDLKACLSSFRTATTSRRSI